MKHCFILFTGDITQKGHDKKKAKILAPFLKTNSQGNIFQNNLLLLPAEKNSN